MGLSDSGQSRWVSVTVDKTRTQTFVLSPHQGAPGILQKVLIQGGAREGNTWQHTAGPTGEQVLKAHLWGLTRRTQEEPA